jgi:hypothetical protein
MSTNHRLEIVSAAATAAGLTVRIEGTHGLVLYPRFTGELEQYNGDIAVQVRATPLGPRYCVYEEYAGDCLSPHWPTAIGNLIHGRLPKAVVDAFWWTYRSWWGWLDTHHWRGLEQACCVATAGAHGFHLECLRQEQEIQAMQEAPGHG